LIVLIILVDGPVAVKIAQAEHFIRGIQLHQAAVRSTRNRKPWLSLPWNL